LLTSAGLRTAQAAIAMSAFYLGSLGGRVGGAWLTRRAGRSVRLLCVSLAVTAAGFLLFWLAGLPVLMIAGLFFCGLGVANLWPLSLALTLAAAFSGLEPWSFNTSFIVELSPQIAYLNRRRYCAR
jgi:MFS family permease